MKLTALSIVILTLSACTVDLWRKGTYYEETLEGFFLAEDMDLLFISGEKYSYTFEISPEFKQLILDHKDKDFFIQYLVLDVDTKNIMTGETEIWIRADEFSSEDRAYFEMLNLKALNNSVYIFSTSLVGERFEALPNIEFQNVKGKRITRIGKPREKTDTLKRLIATPATLVIDAVTVPLVAVGFTLISLMPQ